MTRWLLLAASQLRSAAKYRVVGPSWLLDEVWGPRPGGSSGWRTQFDRSLGAPICAPPEKLDSIRIESSIRCSAHDGIVQFAGHDSALFVFRSAVSVAQSLSPQGPR